MLAGLALGGPSSSASPAPRRDMKNDPDPTPDETDLNAFDHATSSNSMSAAATAAMHVLAPRIEARPQPPHPPHPIFGCPWGKAGGGNGGGRLVEALRPLISGNARSWLVVSVGGGGRGGEGAAWHALDVARRATGICTACIRLR